MKTNARLVYIKGTSEIAGGRDPDVLETVSKSFYVSGCEIEKSM